MRSILVGQGRSCHLDVPRGEQRTFENCPVGSTSMQFSFAIDRMCRDRKKKHNSLAQQIPQEEDPHEFVFLKPGIRRRAAFLWNTFPSRDISCWPFHEVLINACTFCQRFIATSAFVWLSFSPFVIPVSKCPIPVFILKMCFSCS